MPCSPLDLPPLWVCLDEPLPDIQVKIILVIIDLLFLITFLFIYNYSELSLKNLLNLRKKNKNQHETVYSVLNLSFIGLFLIPINNLFSHLSIIIFPSRQAYFLIGFESILTATGIVIHLIGSSLFTLYSFDKIHQIKRKKQLRTIFSTLCVIIFISILILISDLLSFESRRHLLISLIIFLVIFLSGGVLFTLKKFHFSSEIIKFRVIMTYGHFTNFILLASLGSLFFPTGTTSQEWRTQSPSIEVLLFFMNIYAFINVLLIYMGLKLPEWLIERIKILEPDYQEYKQNFDLKENRNLSFKIEEKRKVDNENILLLLDFGYICFSNFNFDQIEDKEIGDLLASRFEILESFSIHNTEELFFVNNIRPSSNLLFLIDELESSTDIVTNGIYRKYQWDINTYNDNIVLDNYVFSSSDWKVALIFGGYSVWSKNHWMYLFLVPNDLKLVFSKFLLNYYFYIEKMAQKGPFLLIIFFERDTNGDYLDIGPDETYSNYPNGQNIRIFTKNEE